jgi:adenylate cyclase
MVATAAAAGALYAIVQAPPNLSWIVEVATGATIGGVIASSILGFELFGAGRWFDRGGRRLPLVVAMLLRTIVYGVVIMAALLVVPWLYSGDAPIPFRPGIVGDVVFSIAATFVFVSLTSIAQVIGPNVLGNLLTGRYYHPREEQRIVLFLDLVGSTAIAEDIGNVRFHALLSDAFTRLSRVVTDSGGEVYRYVGDALIATWPLGAPEENARPIRCLFACRDVLEAARAALLREHEHFPEFRAGLHSGPLVAGEIGGFKREIVLVGDAMNTAARLEQACRTTGHPLLASKALLDRTMMPAGIVATSIGRHLLRGKAERLELFAIERGPRGREAGGDAIARPSVARNAAGANGSRRDAGGRAEAGLSRSQLAVLPGIAHDARQTAPTGDFDDLRVSRRARAKCQPNLRVDHDTHSRRKALRTS